jgi:hypothetical protein
VGVVGARVGDVVGCGVERSVGTGGFVTVADGACVGAVGAIDAVGAAVGPHVKTVPDGQGPRLGSIP